MCAAVQTARWPRSPPSGVWARGGADNGSSSVGGDAAGCAIDSMAGGVRVVASLRPRSTYIIGGGCAAAVLNQRERLRRGEYLGGPMGRCQHGHLRCGICWTADRNGRRGFVDADALSRGGPPVRKPTHSLLYSGGSFLVAQTHACRRSVIALHCDKPLLVLPSRRIHQRQGGHE